VRSASIIEAFDKVGSSTVGKLLVGALVRYSLPVGWCTAATEGWRRRRW